MPKKKTGKPAGKTVMIQVPVPPEKYEKFSKIVAPYVAQLPHNQRGKDFKTENGKRAFRKRGSVPAAIRYLMDEAVAALAEKGAPATPADKVLIGLSEAAVDAAKVALARAEEAYAAARGDLERKGSTPARKAKAPVEKVDPLASCPSCEPRMVMQLRQMGMSNCPSCGRNI